MFRKIKKYKYTLLIVLGVNLSLCMAQDYNYKVYMDISNTETKRLIDTAYWPIVAKHADGPWMLTWELRKGWFKDDIQRKRALGNAFKNKDAIIEIPWHDSWGYSEYPLHIEVTDDCGFNSVGIVYYNEDVGNSMLTQERLDIVKGTLGPKYELYMLARNFNDTYKARIEQVQGVCFEFQVPFRWPQFMDGIYQGTKWAIDLGKKVFYLIPPPNHLNTDHDSYEYLKGVKAFFNTLKTELGDEYLGHENFYFVPNVYNWIKKHYRIKPETLPDGRIANTGTGAALWLLSQRDSTIYKEPENLTKSPLPAEWTASDIGSNLEEGFAYTYNDTFVIGGGGYDGSASQGGTDQPCLGTDSDKMHFVWKRITGDCQITAQVLVPSLSDRWGRAGVMIRDSLTPGSKFAAVYATSGEGSAYQFRTENDQKSLGNAQPEDFTPLWVKLERKGNVFRGFTSSNKTTWMLRGKPEIIMNDDVYIGINATNHSHLGINEPAYITDIEISDSALTETKHEKEVLPEKFKLFQNYPNPFNPETIIHYYLGKPAYVELNVYNAIGEKIRDLVDSYKYAGEYSTIWDAKDRTGNILPSGIYIYTLK